MSESSSATDRESEYFSDSRRLTGPNLFFAQTGAVLEARGAAAFDAAAHQHWRVLVWSIATSLGWGEITTTVRAHQASTSLALSAPLDQLFSATLVNEWAWESATAECYPTFNVSNAYGLDANDIGAPDAALKRLRLHASAEKNRALTALQEAAALHKVALYVDDEVVSIGAGASSHIFDLQQIAAPSQIDFSTISDIPIALVTGSNGKTTTVRLLAAMLKAHRLTPGYSSTEGVVIDCEQVTTGDYSGPAGARTVLRDKRVCAAVLESARGGMLRRGLAVSRADVAVVTNVSADHFGEYGIDNIEDLAHAKLIVARALGSDGVLVLNADDPILMSASKDLWLKVAVFARDKQNTSILKKQREGGLTCAVSDKQLLLSRGDVAYDIGNITTMPLTLNGAATYNIANIAAASLAAFALGIAPATIASTLTQFGQSRFDNPGRLERWRVNGIHVLIDYAHNPAGLSGLLDVALATRAPQSRLGLLLGQAGNREDGDIAALAHTAARYQPDFIVLKDIVGFERGREAGEVAALINKTLQADGVKACHIKIELDEFRAAKLIFNWAHAGDIVVLPMHGVEARQAMRDYLDAAVEMT
jgi:cyanophycin synthetase